MFQLIRRNVYLLIAIAGCLLAVLIYTQQETKKPQAKQQVNPDGSVNVTLPPPEIVNRPTQEVTLPPNQTVTLPDRD